MLKRKTKGFILGLFTFVAAVLFAVLSLAVPKQSVYADTVSLLGETDTFESSHWEDYMACPDQVQGDNDWWIYEGTVADGLKECTKVDDAWWRLGNNWSGAYYRGTLITNTFSTTAGWKAPENGTVKLKGHLSVVALGGGFTFNIYNEKGSTITLLDTIVFDEASDVAYLSGVELTVEKGENYYFEMTPVSSTESRAQVYVWPEFKKTISVGTVSLLGETDTFESSHWEDYMACPDQVQGDNDWWIYEGTVADGLKECTKVDDAWWRLGNNWSGAYYRGTLITNTFSTTAGWKAPENGTVKLKGHLSVVALGGGFTFNIYNEKGSTITLLDTIVFDEASDIAYFSGVELTVEKGESYYFEMTPVNSTESRAQVYVWPEFEKAVETSENSLIGSQEDWDETAYQENSAAWWPANNWTQGNNNWYMYYGSVTDNLGELSHQEGVYWIANNPNNWTGVWHYHIAKTIYDSLVFAWKAPHTGTVAFNGRAFSCTNLGNEEKDFVLKIYQETKSGVALLDQVVVKAGETVYLNNETQQVQAGDVFYFEFDSELNSETDILVNIKPNYTVTATLENYKSMEDIRVKAGGAYDLPTAITAVYSDGVEETVKVSAEDWNTSAVDLTKEGTYPVTATVNGVTATVNVVVHFDGGILTNMSISAAEDFALNYYFKMNAATTSVLANVSMTIDGTEKTAQVNGVKDEEKGLWKFTYPVAAQYYDLDATLTIVQIFEGEEVSVQGATATYSIFKYTEEIKNGDYEATLKTLVSEIVEYGQAAKAYFTGAQVEKLTENVVASEDLVAYKSAASGTQAGVEILGVTLVLEYKTEICVYFTAEDITSLNCSHEAVLMDEESNTYMVKVAVVASDLSEAQTFTIGGITIEYSAFSYIEKVLSFNDLNVNLYNVVQELYDYSVAAKAYLG